MSGRQSRRAAARLGIMRRRRRPEPEEEEDEESDEVSEDSSSSSSVQEEEPSPEVLRRKTNNTGDGGRASEGRSEREPELFTRRQYFPVSDTGAPGTIRKVTPQDLKKQSELRRQYGQLMESFQTFQDKGTIGKDLESMMKKNIKQSNKLFKEIGPGPGDMHLAFLHTKMCTSMILSRTEKIGNSVTGFELNTFLNRLMEKVVADCMGEYSPDYAVEMIAADASEGMKTVPSLVVLVGSFDRDSIRSTADREPRVKPTRRRLLEDDSELRETDVVHYTGDEKGKHREGPEIRAQEILRLLTEDHKQKGGSCNLVEFTMDKDSLSHFLENLFYVSFLTRDGFVSVERKEGEGSRELNTDLLIAPEQPPKTRPGDRDYEISRNQLIFSFNAKKFKELTKKFSGPPHIPMRLRSASSKRRRRR